MTTSPWLEIHSCRFIDGDLTQRVIDVLAKGKISCTVLFCSNIHGFSKTISPILSESDCILYFFYRILTNVWKFFLYLYYLLFLFVPVYHFVLHL